MSDATIALAYLLPDIIKLALACAFIYWIRQLVKSRSQSPKTKPQPKSRPSNRDTFSTSTPVTGIGLHSRE